MAQHWHICVEYITIISSSPRWKFGTWLLHRHQRRQRTPSDLCDVSTFQTIDSNSLLLGYTISQPELGDPPLLSPGHYTPTQEMRRVIRVLNFRLLIISAILASASWIYALATKTIRSPIYIHNSTLSLNVYSPFCFLLLAAEILVRHIVTSVPFLFIFLSPHV